MRVRAVTAAFDHPSPFSKPHHERTTHGLRTQSDGRLETLPAMANVLAQLPQLGFNHSHSPNHPPLPVAPTPAIMAGWGPFVHQPFSNHQLPATRVQKRRLEQEDEDAEGRPDVVMERTPTPERSKRAPPKRARRVDPSSADGPQSNQDSKDGGSSENEVDIGVLLGIFISSLFSPSSLTKYMRSHSTTAVASSDSHCINRFPAFSQANSSRSDTSTDCGKRGTGARSVSKEVEGRIPVFQHLLLLCHPFIIVWPWHLTQSTFQRVRRHAEPCRLWPRITVRHRSRFRTHHSRKQRNER